MPSNATWAQILLVPRLFGPWRNAAGKRSGWEEPLAEWRLRLNTVHTSPVRGWLLGWGLDIWLACSAWNPQPNTKEASECHGRSVFRARSLDIEELLPSASLGSINL